MLFRPAFTFWSNALITALILLGPAMRKQWKLLGPLEAINGVLMLGMSAAALMAILQHLIKTQMREDS